jgi:hypothetical protein
VVCYHSAVGGEPNAAETREGIHGGHPRGDAHLLGKVPKAAAHRSGPVTRGVTV